MNRVNELRAIMRYFPKVANNKKYTLEEVCQMKFKMRCLLKVINQINREIQRESDVLLRQKIIHIRSQINSGKKIKYNTIYNDDTQKKVDEEK